MKLQYLFVICSLGIVMEMTPDAFADDIQEALVLQVIDGDSLKVKSAEKIFQIRLWGIDAPEWGQAFSGEAKNLCRSLVAGRMIHFQEKEIDRYGRVVAVVTVEDLVLNEKMIQAGMAWVYNRYCDEDICVSWQEQEKEARIQGNGLWAGKQPIAPWKWKRIQRSEGRSRN